MNQPIRQCVLDDDRIEPSNTGDENANVSGESQPEAKSNGATHANEVTMHQNNTNETICLTSDQAFEIMIQYANTDSWQTAFERVMGSGDGVGAEGVTMDDDRTSETARGNAVEQESGLNAAGINRISVSNILIDDIEMGD